MAPRHVREHATFVVHILSWEEHRNSEVHESLPCHRHVLRPLLQVAHECYVYGIKDDSRIFEESSSILSAARGKHRISLEGDPITGHERLWNAHGGERGSIVILIPEDQFDADVLFSHCHALAFSLNFRSGHTPAAIRFARERTQERPTVAACLPRNNGIEWMNIFASPKRAESLWSAADKILPRWRPGA